MTKGDVKEVVCAEGYGPAGAAVLVVGPAAGDDLRQLARQVFLSHGGQTGADNSVAYLFHSVGVLRYPGVGTLACRALEAGAEGLRTLDSGEIEVLTDPEDLVSVRDALARRGHQPRAAGTTRRAVQRVTLDAAQGARLAALVTELRALEGVGQVYTNAAVPD